MVYHGTATREPCNLLQSCLVFRETGQSWDNKANPKMPSSPGSPSAKCLASQSHTLRPSSQTFLKKILRLFKLLLSPVAAGIQQAVSDQSTVWGMGLRLNIRPVRICTALSCNWDPSFSASTGGASDIRRSSLAGANNAWSLETAQKYASKYASSILDILHGLGAWSKIPRRYAPGLMRQLVYAGSALPSLNNLLRLFALKAPASPGCSCWTLQGLKQTLRVNDHFGSERMEVWKFIFYHIFQNCVPWEGDSCVSNTIIWKNLGVIKNMHELCLGDEVVFADILKWKVNRAASGIIHVLCPTISRQHRPASRLF